VQRPEREPAVGSRPASASAVMNGPPSVVTTAVTNAELPTS
jgi:hypothetical protein